MHPYPLSKAGQTKQWSKEKGQRDKQRSTRHTHKTKDQVTRAPLKKFHPKITRILENYKNTTAFRFLNTILEI